MIFDLSRRHILDPKLPWLWCRLAAAAPIGPLASEPPYASGAAQKRQKDQNKKKMAFTDFFSDVEFFGLASLW